MDMQGMKSVGALQGSVLLDPYATGIIGRRTFGELAPV